MTDQHKKANNSEVKVKYIIVCFFFLRIDIQPLLLWYPKIKNPKSQPISELKDKFKSQVREFVNKAIVSQAVYKQYLYERM